MFKTNKKLPDEITIDPDVNEIDPNLLKKIDNQFAGNFGIKAKDSQAFRIWIDPNETNGEKHSMIRVGGDTTIGVLNLINRNDRSSFLAN
ncbi:hypothetical protein [Methanothrix sp.]|jgi:hypothetical protein|uniref:hypothetical protein n=1 Tax=Methanothrix sp. TaxID=90426 RepID=UPI003BB4932E